MKRRDAPPNPGILAILDQTEWWYGADGYPERVAELDDEHLANLIGFLYRRADALRRRLRWFEAYHSDESEDALRARWSRELDVGDASDWLRATPLLRALEAEQRRRDALDCEVVDVAELPSSTRHVTASSTYDIVDVDVNDRSSER